MRYTATLLLLLAPLFSLAAEPDTLPGTQPLTVEGDIAAQMVAGIDKFLLRKIDESVEERKRYLEDSPIPSGRYGTDVNPAQRRLLSKLGVVPWKERALSVWPGRAVVDVTLYENLNGCRVRYLKIPVLPHPRNPLPFPEHLSDHDAAIHAEALYLSPVNGREPRRIVYIPGEFGLEDFLGRSSADLSDLGLPYYLAAHDYHVIIPVLTSREVEKRGGRVELSDREYVYRSSFELGRHPIGYDLERVLACAIWISNNVGCRMPLVDYVGVGDGGQLALYAGAVDQYTSSVYVKDYFKERHNLWAENIDRNVFGLLNEFGDAEIARLILPSRIIIDGSHGPQWRWIMPRDQRFAPDNVKPEIERELKRLRTLAGEHADKVQYFDDTESAVKAFLGERAERLKQTDTPKGENGHARDTVKVHNAKLRQTAEVLRYNQALLAETPYVRKERFWDKLDYSSVEAFEKSVAPFREEFKHEVIGHFDDKPLPFNPRTRKAYDEEKWVGYEVMLDLWPDVFCYGILCLPKDLKRDGSEKRPVVVCQHGLEGRPQDIVTGDHRAYHDFASKLCERGFITFSPQNLYIGGDKFRTLQRKANPLGKTLFSIITPQHQQILDWLQTLPYADGERIGFYGLSYGGKTAMRVPPLVDDYKCVICSADFNDWVWKNASTRSPYSYVWTGEYEIFEWNLAHTFNYAEMAALIAPRPFMVERGHFDGVAPDERVASEFAKVRHLYAARLKLPADHCQIEWFAGPHTINGQGTFAFLHQHLNWPEPRDRDVN